MKNLYENFKGIYLTLKRENSHFVISKDKLKEKISNFPNWMESQIEVEFSYFNNKKIDLDQTILNFKKYGFLKKAQLLKIKILDNKFFYQNFLPIKNHPRFVSLKNFFRTASKFIKFPNSEFLYSIHDSFDDERWLECLKAPIFCISKLKGNNQVVLFPHVEWMEKNDTLLKSICQAALQFKWEDKINKAFWRGSITGFEDLSKNERFKIVKFSQLHPEKIEANFSDLSLLKNPQLKDFIIKNNISPSHQLQYKYLLAIDGNAFPGSFFWQLFSNSLILKNKSNYLEWYYPPLRNNEQYIEYINESDLLDKINHLNQSDEMCKKIISSANAFANEYLSNESILSCIYKVLVRYSLLQK